MPTTHMSFRARTADRGPPHTPPPSPKRDDVLPPMSETSSVLTVSDIGPKRKMLPNGSMLCEDVPIARTGWLTYLTGEIPLKPAQGSPLIFVYRSPDELFSEMTMSSFLGCAISNDHPPVFVTSRNWSSLAKGHIQAVRRGSGEDADILFADLLVTDQWLIDQINQGLREVSVGYDASYQQTADGEGLQLDIIGNHLALVEKGRCGPRCAIGDRQPTEENIMPEQIKPTRARVPLLEQARERVRIAQEDLETIETAADDGIHVHVHVGDKAATLPQTNQEGQEGASATRGNLTLDAATEARLAGLEAGQQRTEELLKQIAAGIGKPASQPQTQGEEDPELATAATGDSAALARSYTELASQAEILVPGYRVQTFDSALPRKLTVDAMCLQRRIVLGMAMAQPDGIALVKAANGGTEPNIAALECPAVATLFKASAMAKAAINNRQATGDAGRMSVPEKKDPPKQKSIADLNKEAAAFWGRTPA